MSPAASRPTPPRPRRVHGAAWAAARRPTARSLDSSSSSVPSLRITWVGAARLLLLGELARRRAPRARWSRGRRRARPAVARRRRPRRWRRRRPPSRPRTAAAPRPPRAARPGSRPARHSTTRSPTSGCSSRLEPGELVGRSNTIAPTAAAVDLAARARPPRPSARPAASRIALAAEQLVDDGVGRERRRAERRTRPAPRTCRRRCRRSGRRTARVRLLVGRRLGLPRLPRLGGSRGGSSPPGLGSLGRLLGSAPAAAARSAAGSASAAASGSRRPARPPPRARGRLGAGRLGEDLLGEAAGPRSRSRLRRGRLRVRLQLGRRSGRAAADLALDALDAQREPAALLVDLEDLHPDLVAGLDDLARVLDVVLGELGDVDEALDAGEDLDERAEGDDLGDLALELVADACRCRRPAATGPPGSA